MGSDAPHVHGSSPALRSTPPARARANPRGTMRRNGSAFESLAQLPVSGRGSCRRCRCAARRALARPAALRRGRGPLARSQERGLGSPATIPGPPERDPAAASCASAPGWPAWRAADATSSWRANDARRARGTDDRRRRRHARGAWTVRSPAPAPLSSPSTTTSVDGSARSADRVARRRADAALCPRRRSCLGAAGGAAERRLCRARALPRSGARRSVVARRAPGGRSRHVRARGRRRGNIRGDA